MKSVENLVGGPARGAPTTRRIWFALCVAVAIDALQFALGPLGWIFVDEGLDVVGMIIISWAIGFHILLLPTFILKLLPGPDMLPTWTACTAAVIMIRKRANARQAPPPIDVATVVTPVEHSEPGTAEAAATPASSVPPKLSTQPPL